MSRSSRPLWERYHAALAAGDPAGEWEQLQAGMQQERLMFRDRPICTVLRPLLMARAEFERIRLASEQFYTAIGRLYDMLLADDTLRARMGLLPVEEEALALDPGFPSPDGVGRLDGFLDRSGTLRFVEYNADSPGGLGFGHRLAELFTTLPTMRAFAAEHPVLPVRPLDRLLSMLVGTYRAWGGHAPRPRIAIVDWEGQGTAAEFALCKSHFQQAGYPTIITHPAALELRGGRLWDQLSHQPIDLVYKRVLIGELLEREGLDNVLTRAMQARVVPMMNSYRMQLLFKKALFALLSEMEEDGRFSPVQQAAIRTHLPWTRIVREGRTRYQGAEIDLLPFIADNPSMFVLKPNSEYGGSGVVLGWECPADGWQRALERAASAEIPFVVQERIAVATEPFPLWRDGALQIEPRIMDLDPYTFGRTDVFGAGVRLGTGGLLNVTAGGGSAVPLVLVD